MKKPKRNSFGTPVYGEFKKKDYVSLEKPLTVFSTGATRSNDANDVAYDLISPWAYERLAKIYAEGAKVHGPRNWEKGQPISVVVNHAVRHFTLWQQGNREEDHLAKTAWGLFALMHFEKTKPKLFKEEDVCE